MKKWSKILIGAVIMFVCVYFCFYALFPILLAGKPLPLFSIENEDTKEHEVVIEILDSSNKTVLREVYRLKPGEMVSYERGFGWYPKVTWYFITWSEGVYTFKITLDGKTTKTHVTRVYPHKETVISLYNDSISIREVAV